MTFIMYFSLLPPYICVIQKGNSPPHITRAKDKHNEIKTTTYANDLFRRSIPSNDIEIFKLFRS